MYAYNMIGNALDSVTNGSLYTASLFVEKQLKERLVGAAVLVIIAVACVPEWLSGANTVTAVHPGTTTKTYAINLQQSDSVQMPATITTSAPIQPTPAQTPLPATTPTAVQTTAITPTSVATTTAAATQPVVAAVPEVAPVAASSGAWAIQLGSFSSKATATDMARRLNKQSYSTFVQPVVLQGKTLYRVRIGPMASRAAAEHALVKLKTTHPRAAVVTQ